MRRILLNISLLTLVIAPLTAHAGPTGTTDILTLTETIAAPGGTPLGTTYSLLIPARPTTFTPVYLGPTFEGITLNGIPVSVDGAPASLDQVGFGTAAAGGGFVDLTNPTINIFSANFFNDSPTAPAFLIGTGTADDGTDTFSYSLSSAASAATPEPSSLLLLGTGALGLCGVLRRRYGAQA